MNVACTACPAKYSVPDEKVRGKKVKITCKHCGTAIVVDGTDLGPGPAQKDALTSLGPVLPDSKLGAAEPPLIVPPKEAPAAAAPAEISWMVGYPDDRQEQHTTSEIVSLYKSGKMDDECFVWRDGMADWLAPFDVPEVAEALKKAGLSKRAPMPLNDDEEDEATRVAPSPFDMEASEPPPPFVPAPAPAAAPTPAAAPAPAAAKPAPAAAFPAPTPAATKSEPKPAEKPPEAKPAPAAKAAEAPRAAQIKPAAARRNAPERGGVDLFGSVDTAGSESEDDSAPQIGGSAHDDAQKLTGARNESSVLFSLDALAKVEKPKPKDKKKDDSAAAAALFGESSPNSLMNVGGGGLGILAAPDFTKPAAPAPEPVRVTSDVELAAPPAKSGGSMWVGIGIGVAIALIGGGAFFFLNKKPDADKTAPVTSATTAATTAKPEASEPSTAPSAPSTAAAAAESSSAAAPAASASAAVAGKPAAPGTPAGAAATPAAGKPGDAKKPETPAPAAAGGADFDRSAAVASLGAAAANAASCRKPDGPFGTGKASVTFAPSGRATQANITGAFAGTEVGGCVARIFRAAKVPPFGGDPVTVSKSFSIE